MEEFKGCKGAWVHHKPHGYQHYVGGWIQSEKGKICDVAGLDVGREAAFANASLIASAPDLLKELQRLRDYVINICGVDDEDCDAEHPLMSSMAAISKALGEE